MTINMIPHPGSDVSGVFTPWTGKPADYKLIVDFFAGGGGASKGIELALGRSPDIAANFAHRNPLKRRAA